MKSITDDIKAAEEFGEARRRIIPNFAARAEGMTPGAPIGKLLKEVPADGKLDGKKAG